MSYYYQGTFEEFMLIWNFWFTQIGVLLFMFIDIIINEARR